jgi:TPR repeat protein
MSPSTCASILSREYVSIFSQPGRDLTMRLALLAAALSLLVLSGCSGVHFARGLPVIAKPSDGVLITGAQGLPDIDRGNQARLAGRLDDAERDLLPLAQRGYTTAQVYLAAVYGQREAMEAQDEAIKWYRAALPRRPDVVVPLARVLMRHGDRASVLEAAELLRNAPAAVEKDTVGAALLDLYSLFPPLDVTKQAPALAKTAGQSAIPGVRAAAINWYRATIADAGNARKLIELCRKNLEEVPACFVDLATYYRYSRNQKALTDLVHKAMESLQRQASTANFDNFYYDPIALPPIASRLAVALIDQPASDYLVELTEELALASAAERDAEAEAGEQSIEAMTTAGALPQIAESAAASAPLSPSPVATVRLPAAPLSASSTSAPSSTTAQPELADKLLRWMLKQSDTMSVEAAGVSVGYPYLLPDVNLESLLQTGEAAGIPRASLYLGQLYYFNQRVPREATLGEASLLQAIRFRETAAPGHYRLGRLYQQGYLGRPDPQKALDYFLYAARRRVTAADTHLARLFYDSPGTRVDRVNSYVFARLSEDGGAPVVIHTLRGGVLGSYRLLDRLRAELTADELKRAEALYRRELEVHLVTRPIIPPDVWVKEAG